jgi:hypothetical protein
MTGAQTAAVLDRVRRLHAATTALPDLDLEREAFDASFVPVLEAAIDRALDGHRDAGPQSGWLRGALAAARPAIRESLARFRAGREAALAGGRGRWVVTHGEPHGENVVWTPTGPVLVDCGELRLAPPERDLVVLGSAGDEELASLYRRRWVLAEIAEYADRLSRPHGDDAEDRRAREELARNLAVAG